MALASPTILVVGAGMGGLAAAIDLARQGFAVTVLERAAAPGGKLRVVDAGGSAIDAGPTVFTMRWVFKELFADAGAEFSRAVTLRPADILARHAWDAAGHLDLYADLDRSADAVAAFAGAREAAGFRAFMARAAATYQTLAEPFIRSARPSVASLVMGSGLRGLGDLAKISPFATLWRALDDHFRDPRLKQLFGRYATYAGSSPFLAPATIMLIAHVEQDGVWLVDGGMFSLARALAALATSLGVTIRYGAHVGGVRTRGGRACGVTLASGEILDAGAVVVNADVGAVAAGLFGPDARGAVPRGIAAPRSLSALTWAMRARVTGTKLSRHTVFFGTDYAREFSDVFSRGKLPGAPTVYVCAQDRGAADEPAPDGAERLLVLVNAPHTGDTRPPTETEIERCWDETQARMAQCGLHLTPEAVVRTGPAEFAEIFPGTGGCLYGPALHTPTASFSRAGSRTKLPGLYLAGGSTHPGAGVPMAVLSGRLAAACVTQDLASRGRSRATATSGGISTR